MKYQVRTLQNIGCALRDLRKQQKLTQQEAAEKVGLLAKTVSGMETASTNYSIESLMKLLAAVGGTLEIVPLKDLIQEIEDQDLEW